MKTLGHTQDDVFVATGVPQPQISRALAGRRKRLTKPMRALCRYACIEIKEGTPPATSDELVELVRELAGDSAAAASALHGVLSSIAPLLRRIGKN
jgi:transcription termination factor NusB